MRTQSKLRKKSFTVVEQACHQVRGFKKLHDELDDKVRLSGHSHSTLTNYARKLAQLSLHFGKLSEHIGEKEMNKYLANLARTHDDPHPAEQIQQGPACAVFASIFCHPALYASGTSAFFRPHAKSVSANFKQKEKP